MVPLTRLAVSGLSAFLYRQNWIYFCTCFFRIIPFLSLSYDRFLAPLNYEPGFSVFVFRWFVVLKLLHVEVEKRIVSYFGWYTTLRIRMCNKELNVSFKSLFVNSWYVVNTYTYIHTLPRHSIVVKHTIFSYHLLTKQNRTSCLEVILSLQVELHNSEYWDTT